MTTSTGKVFQTEIEWGKKDMLYACVLDKGPHKSAGCDHANISYDVRPHDWGIQ